MPRRPLPTSAADWLILAVTPALLIGMVTCLLFFILAVFYRGDFDERLHWILFAGVVGMVLIGRIHLIEEISRRAGLYSGILGILVVIALIRFVPPPAGWPAMGHYFFCAGLVVLGFVVTRILVADTTDIHSETTIDGEGLLRAAGLEDDPAARLRREVERRDSDTQPGKKGYAKKGRETPDDQGEGDSPGNGDESRSKNRRKAPGVSIVWFSALALPMFGIGQGFIPPEELKTRWYTLMLLVGYMGSGFLLLLTSSFLGFRRYLARRGLSMPATMAGVWIVGGMLLVGAVLLVALLIPRPSDIGPLQTLSALTGKKLEPIRRVEKKTAEGQGDKQTVGKDMNDRREDGKGMEKPSPEADRDSKQQRNNGEKAEGKGKAGGKSAQGKGEGKNAKGNAGNQGKGAQAKNQDDGNPKDQKGQRNEQGKDGPDKQASRESEGDKRGLGEGKKQGDKDGPGKEKEAPANDNASPPPPPESNMGQFSQAIRTLLKLMAAGLAVGVAIAFAAVCLSMGWSPAETLNRWIAWLQGLFRRKEKEGVWSPKANEEDSEPLPAFTDFPDPFSGRKQLPARELVRVTFRAIQAWGADQGDPMLEGETPNEYFRRLAGLHPVVEEGLEDFCLWHDLAEYAREQPLEECREPVRELWRGLRNGARLGRGVGSGAG